jgi:hypothetical protein
MKTGIKLLVILITMIILFVPACKRAPQGPAVKDLAMDLQNRLDKLDAAMAELLAAHDGKLNTEEEIRAFLDSGLKINPAILSSCYIDSLGVLKYLSPAEYKSAEGSDISAQEHIVQMMTDPKPVFSKAFKAVEGFMTVVIGHPITNADKKFVGAYVVTLDPQKLVNQLLSENKIPEEYELWAMQSDGMIVCDQDQEELGKNIFTDEMYNDFQDLRDLAKRITTEPAGEGEYSFWATGTYEEAKKAATWDTLALHGREWRVILVKRV